MRLRICWIMEKFTKLKCIYCNEEIIKESKEHIIHNALGGTLKSTCICCDKCNNILSKQDSEFSQMFNPIIMHLPNFQKENNYGSSVTINAEIIFEQKKYNAIVKNKKITSIPELQREKKQDIERFSDIDSYQFEFFKITNSKIFKNGFRKIAFNYAIDIFRKKNISTDILIKNITIIKDDKNKVKTIDFNQGVLPFYTETWFETIIDLNDKEVFHNLILFTDNKKKLWCYIGLFNTFKYYVLLAENCNSIINEEYCQKVSKIDHNVDFLHIRRPKDKVILSQEFNIDITLEDEDFIKQIKEKIMKRNNVFDYYDYMNNLINDTVFLCHWIKRFPELLQPYRDGYNYYTKNTNNKYTEEEKYIDSEKYKKKILYGNDEISYPIFLYNNFDENMCKEFCAIQLEKLYKYIISVENKE